MKKIVLLLFILILFQHLSFAQDKHKFKMDSLKIAFQNAKQDTTRLKVYDELCNECDVKDNMMYAVPAEALADKLAANARKKAEKKKYLSKKADYYRFYIAYYDSQGPGALPKILECMQKQLTIYKGIEDNEGIKNSYISIANYYSKKGDMFKRLEILKEGLSYFEKINYKTGISRFLVQIEFLYADQGDTAQAIDYSERALKLEKEIGDTTRISRGLFLMGVFYNKIHRNDKAIEYYNKAIPRYEIIKDNVSLADLYNNIGKAYQEKGDLPNALESFLKSMTIGQNTDRLDILGQALLNAGEIYNLQGNFSKAIEYHQKCLALSIEKNIGDYGIALSCFNLAKDYLSKKDYVKAKQNSERSLQAMKKVGKVEEIGYVEKLAAKIDSAGNNFKDAYLHYQQYVLIKAKLNSEEVHKAAQREKFQRDYEKQKAIEKEEQDKKDALANAELKQQTFQRNAFIGGFALMLLLAGVSYRNFRIKKKDNAIITEQKNVVETQKQLVEEKNREILDSIEYALRIQTAILPPTRIVKQYLENSFILYKPKDIVAGDFYWIETVQFENENQFENMKMKDATTNFQIDKFSNSQIILFAACDCTGHGVPGAMVSVVCHNALNRAVREFGLTQPAAILDKTREIVIENFSKSEEDIKDGMDISLCALTPPPPSFKEGAGGWSLQWAGANNPLWLLKNGELLETKADKQPIGMNENSKPFTNHSFTLNTGDTIYLFTDGFADQFGGETGEKKLTKKRFKELVLSIQNKTMQEQGTALDTFITEYRKEVEQIDDILVMGVRV